MKTFGGQRQQKQFEDSGKADCTGCLFASTIFHTFVA